MIQAVSVGIVVADCVARPVMATPARGQLALVDHVGLYAGGSAATTGYALARFGTPTAVIGRVGMDGFGDFLEGEARRHGAEAWLRRDERVGTSATLVTVDEHGERSFLHSIGANALLTPQDVDLSALRARGARHLHLAGFFALPGLEGADGSPTRELFARARAMGFTTSLDCVWDGLGRWSSLLEGVLPETDVFCPNLDEARALSGQEDAASAADALLEMGVRQVVVIKMGAQGALAVSRSGEACRFGVAPVDTVDGTGSGDAFYAGFLFGWLAGQDLPGCTRLGSAAGAMCVRALGAMSGVTGPQELHSLARLVPAMTGGQG